MIVNEISLVIQIEIENNKIVKIYFPLLMDLEDKEIEINEFVIFQSSPSLLPGL